MPATHTKIRLSIRAPPDRIAEVYFSEERRVMQKSKWSCDRYQSCKFERASAPTIFAQAGLRQVPQEAALVISFAAYGDKDICEEQFSFLYCWWGGRVLRSPRGLSSQSIAAPSAWQWQPRPALTRQTTTCGTRSRSSFLESAL